MFNYARSDTHFLLYIYDNMRNELIQKSDPSQPEGDLIELVMKDSKEESLQRYERPRYDVQSGSGAMGWSNMLYRTPALFNREQFAVFRAAHQWRDALARQEDESVHAIMPKHVLFNIAREMPLDMPALLGCSHPMSRPFLKKKKDLLDVIKQARLAGVTGPDMKAFTSVAQPDFTGHVVKASEAERVLQISPNSGGADYAIGQSSRSDSLARVQMSRFWGPTVLGIAASSMYRIQFNDDMLRLALPLPQLTAEVFEDHKVIGKAAASVPQNYAGARAEHQFVKERKPRKDDIFVVRQIGGSGKRKASDLRTPPQRASTEEDGKVPNGSLLGVNAKQQDIVDAKPDRTKEEKHQRKLERKRQKIIDSAEKQAPEDAEPFDYASAPSVLHARHSGNGRIEGVNPYAKAADAPKGMRKTQKEIPGRSFTFKR